MHVQIVQGIEIICHSALLIQKAGALHPGQGIFIFLIPSLGLAQFCLQIILVLGDETVHLVNQVLVLGTIEHPLREEGAIVQICHIFFAETLVSPADQGCAVIGDGIILHGSHESQAVLLQHAFVLAQIFILSEIHELSIVPLFEQFCVIPLGEINLGSTALRQGFSDIIVLQLCRLQKSVPFLLRGHSVEHVPIALEQFESQVSGNLRQRHHRHGSAQDIIFHIGSMLQLDTIPNRIEVGDMPLQRDAFRVGFHAVRQLHFGHEIDDIISDYAHGVIIAVADHLALLVGSGDQIAQIYRLLSVINHFEAIIHLKAVFIFAEIHAVIQFFQRGKAVHSHIAGLQGVGADGRHGQIHIRQEEIAAYACIHAKLLHSLAHQIAYVKECAASRSA